MCLGCSFCRTVFELGQNPVSPPKLKKKKKKRGGRRGTYAEVFVIFSLFYKCMMFNLEFKLLHNPHIQYENELNEN